MEREESGKEIWSLVDDPDLRADENLFPKQWDEDDDDDDGQYTHNTRAQSSYSVVGIHIHTLIYSYIYYNICMNFTYIVFPYM